jgi:hypothetical protein
LGTQDNLHQNVSVISPFALGESKITRMVVKVLNDNNLSGDAELHNDDGLITGAECRLEPGSNAPNSICIADGFVEFLEPNDSLSVYVVTDSGSFKGASACIILESANGLTSASSSVTATAVTEKKKKK